MCLLSGCINVAMHKGYGTLPLSRTSRKRRWLIPCVKIVDRDTESPTKKRHTSSCDHGTLASDCHPVLSLDEAEHAG